MSEKDKKGRWVSGATEQNTRLRIQATSTIKSDGAPERPGVWQRFRNRLGHMTASQRLGSIIDHLFSPRNLKYARAFAEAWEEEVFVQAVLAQNRGSVRIRATEYGKQVSLLCGR